MASKFEITPMLRPPVYHVSCIRIMVMARFYNKVNYSKYAQR